MTLVLQLSHVPLRPSFDCATCGWPWPCAAAKVELIEQCRGDALRLRSYLSGHMADAMDHAAVDRGWGPVDGMFERFVGWTRATEHDRPVGPVVVRGDADTTASRANRFPAKTTIGSDPSVRSAHHSLRNSRPSRGTHQPLRLVT